MGDEWDEVEQMATLLKFDDWGGYGVDSLWNDLRYTQNNIDTYAVPIFPSRVATEIALENEEIDGIDNQFELALDAPWLSSRPNIQIRIYI